MLDRMPPTEDLDFLLVNGGEYAILGSGERVRPGAGGLPRDAGMHLVLGTARTGGLETIGHLPGVGIYVERSGRWLGVGVGDDELHLFDSANGLRPGFRFQTTGKIHPHGDLIAVRDGDHLHLHAPDGHLVRSAHIPRSREWWAFESIEFSACGDFLWHVSTPSDGKAVLSLLHCPSLEVCDSHTPERGWGEVMTSINSATGHLAVCTQAGDSFITIRFYHIRKSKIRPQTPHIARGQGLIDRPLDDEPAFAVDGKRFLVLEMGGVMHEFSFPDCRHLASTWDGLLSRERDDTAPRIDGYAYYGPLVLLSLGAEILALRSGDLLPCPLPVKGAGHPLCKGLLASSPSKRTEVSRHRLTSRPFPVVAVLDSDSTRATAAYRKVRSHWHDITAEVGWLETNFSVAR